MEWEGWDRGEGRGSRGEGGGWGGIAFGFLEAWISKDTPFTLKAYFSSYRPEKSSSFNISQTLWVGYFDAGIPEISQNTQCVHYSVCYSLCVKLFPAFFLP